MLQGSNTGIGAVEMYRKMIGGKTGFHSKVHHGSLKGKKLDKLLVDGLLK